MSPIVNTHVHIPPNFSAFDTVDDLIQAARAQGVAALGVSNFFDISVYARFRDQARAAGIWPLYGVEFITVVPELQASGLRVNDPANPGRMYVTGKGIDPFRPQSAATAAIAARIRDGNDERARRMVEKVAQVFADAGFDTGLTADQVIGAVALRGGVPRAWVSLQERHIARAFQEQVAGLDPSRRAGVLHKVYGRESGVDLEDPVALQSEIRARLLKAGAPGFVPEVPLPFADAYAYITGMGGIPCYPILADGCDPVCQFEASPTRLARSLADLGIHAAELIPVRNHRGVVDEYTQCLADAGMIVMAGTEHNTCEQIPVDPFCVDGPVSPAARAVFFEAACVVAAHADAVSRGCDGFVDSQGNLACDDQGRAALSMDGRRLVGGAPT
ncbi:MAG: PHP domain-containing protein [Propionibacteriaceae bacterium]|nr:PHP domain-containing protein [Propionibacteriaceae bacterium]